MDNSGKDSDDLVLSRAFETQIATSEEGPFLHALAYSWFYCLEWKIFFCCVDIGMLLISMHFQKWAFNHLLL